MTRFIPTLEQPTAESLFPPGYLLANRDLRKAFGDDHRAATEHFRRHGARERRLQVTRGFFEWKFDAAIQAARFDYFRPCLDIIPQQRRFPLWIGRGFEQIEAR